MPYIRGFKAFNKDLINGYGEKFELKKEYVYDGEIYKDHGFHFCTNMEDTLRYYDAQNGEIDICEVIGYGKISSFYDSYYDYDISIADHMLLVRILTREEIIEYASHLWEERLCRFIAGMKLTEEEIQRLYECCPTRKVQDKIDYYQYGKKDVYDRW